MKEERIQCETKEGKPLELGFNGTHWIAYDENGEKVGAPMIKMNDLKYSLGIDYDESAPVPEVVNKDEEPEIIRLNGKLKDGTEVKCLKDKYHWRCFNGEDKQIGQPFVELSILEKEIGIILTVKKTAAAVVGKGDIENTQDNEVDGEPICNEGKEETPEVGMQAGTNDVPAIASHPKIDEHIEEQDEACDEGCDGGELPCGGSSE